MHYLHYLIYLLVYSLYARLFVYLGLTAVLFFKAGEETSVKPNTVRACCDCEDHSLHQEALKEVDDYLNRSKL